MLTARIADKPRFRRMLAILAGVLILACLAAGACVLYDAFVIRFEPDRLMTARQLDAAGAGRDVIVLVEVVGVGAGVTDMHGVLVEKTPGDVYRRTTRTVRVYVTLDTVDVLGRLGNYQPGDVVQIEGTIEAAAPEIVLRFWHGLAVTEQIDLN